MYAGIDWFPGKSQSCRGTCEESNGDEQDSKADQCRDCPDEMNLMEGGNQAEKQLTIVFFCVTI